MSGRRKQRVVPRFDENGEEIETSARTVSYRPGSSKDPEVVSEGSRELDSAERADVRGVIERVVDQAAAADAFPEAIRSMLWEMLDARKVGWGYCDGCRQKIPIEFPDYKGRMQALQMLLAEAKGRPTERREVEVKVRTLQEMEQLSDEELQRFIEAGRQ